MDQNRGTLEHTADLGIWVEADSLELLFERAVTALAELLVQTKGQGEVHWHELDMQAPDLVDLMVEYLNEAVYLLDAEGRLPLLAEIALVQSSDSKAHLKGRIGAVDFDPSQHQGLNAVKAATYHQAMVERHGGRWRAEVYLDV